MIPQSLILTLGFLAAVFVITFYAYATNSLIILYLMVCIPPAVFLINRKDLLLIWTIMIFFSTVTLPIFPQNFNLFYMLSLFLVFIMVAYRVITKREVALNATHRFALVYAAILIGTASVRGFGLRAFGGASWGGAGYVQLWIVISLLLVSRYVDLDARQWRHAVYGLCLMTLLPSMAQVLYAASGGRIWQQYYIITPDYAAVTLLHGVQAQEDLVRLQQAGWFGYQVYLLALMLRRPGIPNLFVQGFLTLLAFILAGVSGHRLAVVVIVLTGLAYYGLGYAGLWKRVFNRYSVALGLMLLVMALFARQLPMSFQRALSIVPFADVSLEAKISAQSTSAWRLDLWKRMLKEMPKYLLVGRGFAFSPNDLATMSISSNEDSMEQSLAAHNYHNGPLSLLMDLGIVGFLCGSGIMLSALWRHYRRLGAAWHNQTLRHIHRVLVSGFVTQVFVFFFIFGDARSSLIQLMVSTLILDGVVRADTREGAPPAVDTSLSWQAARTVRARA